MKTSEYGKPVVGSDTYAFCGERFEDQLRQAAWQRRAEEAAAAQGEGQRMWAASLLDEVKKMAFHVGKWAHQQ